VKHAEREMIHDAIAEAVVHAGNNPDDDAARYDLAGMRHGAGMLGMPEGHSGYDWSDEQGHTPVDKRTRRLLVIRRRTKG
jgi:hypothetical protein